MRARYRGLVSAIGVTATLVVLAGCGSDSTDTNAPSVTAGTSGAHHDQRRVIAVQRLSDALTRDVGVTVLGLRHRNPDGQRHRECENARRGRSAKRLEHHGGPLHSDADHRSLRC